MICIPNGRILSVRDCGTIWQLYYQVDNNGLGVVNFDHRPFSHFYEGVTGRNFFEDYAFGRGRQYVSSRLVGRRVSVDGEPFNQMVRIADE